VRELSRNPGISFINKNHQNSLKLQVPNIMIKGKATAVVSGRTVAETDEYEFVEGNVYV
jgi:hypothetical protein